MGSQDLVEKILPSLYKITLPVPMKALKSVFAYLALDEKDDRQNLLIDTGWGDEETYRALTGAFLEIGFEKSKLKTIVVSHLHPDHFGLSSRLRKEVPDSKLLMHELDAAGIRSSETDYTRFVDELHKWIDLNGTPEFVLNEMIESFASMTRYINPVKPDVLLMGGESLRVGTAWNFKVIHTPGHTRGNICLFEEKKGVFFSGDHVLPTITPNVSLGPLYEEGDPLGDYLKSLQELKLLRPKLVLPSHEFVFEDLPKRLEQIEVHHAERLEDTKRAFTSGKEFLSAYVVASKLHWYTGSWEKLSAWEKRAAMMETLAHLEYLRRKREVSMKIVVEYSSPREEGKKKAYYSLAGRSN